MRNIERSKVCVTAENSKSNMLIITIINNNYLK